MERSIADHEHDSREEYFCEQAYKAHEEKVPLELARRSTSQKKQCYPYIGVGEMLTEAQTVTKRAI